MIGVLAIMGHARLMMDSWAKEGRMVSFLANTLLTFWEFGVKQREEPGLFCEAKRPSRGIATEKYT
jgi:hypothetical protein